MFTRNISVFCLLRVALHFKGMWNSKEFYKRVFLHIFPARIIVPCLKIIYLSAEEIFQLKALVRNKKIISHKTDKGNTVVINYKEKYTGGIPKLYYKR